MTLLGSVTWARVESETAYGAKVVPPLSVGELLVHLGGLGVDEVCGELTSVAPEERVRQRAVAPEEPGQVEAHEQARERVEQQVERRGQDGPREHEPVWQRVVEVARHQHRLRAGAAVADDADRLDGRQAELGERAQQLVLALREPRRQFLERVEGAVVVDEANDVAADPALDVDEPWRLPAFERLIPGQVEEVGMTGADDEPERH